MKTKAVIRNGKLIFVVSAAEVKKVRKRNRPNFEATVKRFERNRANVSGGDHRIVL